VSDSEVDCYRHSTSWERVPEAAEPESRTFLFGQRVLVL
jgi:hypothetical protein